MLTWRKKRKMTRFPREDAFFFIMPLLVDFDRLNWQGRRPLRFIWKNKVFCEHHRWRGLLYARRPSRQAILRVQTMSSFRSLNATEALLPKVNDSSQRVAMTGSVNCEARRRWNHSTIARDEVSLFCGGATAWNINSISFNFWGKLEIGNDRACLCFTRVWKRATKKSSLQTKSTLPSTIFFFEEDICF